MVRGDLIGAEAALANAARGADGLAALVLAEDTVSHFYDAELLRLRSHTQSDADESHSDISAALEGRSWHARRSPSKSQVSDAERSVRSATRTRYALSVRGAVTVHMNAPAQKIWELVADVRNTGRFSPETFDAEWLDGVTEPAVGARFRGHVKRNEIGPVYWTTCRVTACEPAREFSFEVLVGKRAVNNWHYEFTPTDGGTDVTESFWIPVPSVLRATAFLGFLRKRRNMRDMRTTLERIQDVVEATRP